ncbi:MAG: hypothetical protein ACU843_03365 [Gammaproteobacteria bacterium]
MNNTSFLKKSAVILALGIAATNVWGFGGGGGRDRLATCEEPRFKNMKPPKIIAPGGKFSFTASDNTEPDSIKVLIKGHDIPLKVDDAYGIQVSGNMPSEVTDGYALIKISANSRPRACVGEGAWLVKIVE